MNLPRNLLATGSLARPLRGDAEPWEFASSAASRASFDPFARRVRPRPHFFKASSAGWRILLNVLRIR